MQKKKQGHCLLSLPEIEPTLLDLQQQCFTTVPQHRSATTMFHFRPLPAFQIEKNSAMHRAHTLPLKGGVLDCRPTHPSRKYSRGGGPKLLTHPSRLGHPPRPPTPVSFIPYKRGLAHTQAHLRPGVPDLVVPQRQSQICEGGGVPERRQRPRPAVPDVVGAQPQRQRRQRRRVSQPRKGVRAVVPHGVHAEIEGEGLQ